MSLGVQEKSMEVGGVGTGYDLGYGHGAHRHE